MTETSSLLLVTRCETPHESKLIISKIVTNLVFDGSEAAVPDFHDFTGADSPFCVLLIDGDGLLVSRADRGPYNTPGGQLIEDFLGH